MMQGQQECQRTEAMTARGSANLKDSATPGRMGGGPKTQLLWGGEEGGGSFWGPRGDLVIQWQWECPGKELVGPGGRVVGPGSYKRAQITTGEPKKK